MTGKKASHFSTSGVSYGVDRAHEINLVRALKEGDEAAFDEIYEAHRARLYSFLLRLSRRAEVAEELLQEMWLRLARCAPLLRDDTCLAAWLFTVARNLFAGYCRNRFLDADRTAEYGRVTLRREADSPFDLAAADEAGRRLERAIAILPVHYREALLLASEGIPHDEAAAICQVRPEAFRKRLSRAREMVGAHLGRMEGR